MKKYSSFEVSALAVLLPVMAAICTGSAVAQTAPMPSTGVQAATAPQPPARQALTATEQAAVAQMLNQVNSLSGNSLQAEVRRLAKQYSDQHLNLTAIAAAAKTAAGNKLGAINIAFAAACKEAPSGSAESVAVCAAAAAQADGQGPTNPLEVAALPSVAGIQTAAVGGAGGGGGGGLTGGGNATGSGNSSLTSGNNGMQAYSAFANGLSSRRNVGTSVSTR